MLLHNLCPSLKRNTNNGTHMRKILPQNIYLDPQKHYYYFK